MQTDRNKTTANNKIKKKTANNSKSYITAIMKVKIINVFFTVLKIAFETKDNLNKCL